MMTPTPAVSSGFTNFFLINWKHQAPLVQIENVAVLTCSEQLAVEEAHTTCCVSSMAKSTW